MSNVIQLRRANEICCSGCGSIAEAACDCGLPYVTPVERAAEAVLAHPEKSNRRIGEEIGVAKDTVRRARNKSIGAPAPRLCGEWFDVSEQFMTDYMPDFFRSVGIEYIEGEVA